jgi:hypothetical protein
MMPYAAYLRVYEPLSAFGEPDRTRWAAYATSAARPRRLNALAEEYTGALRRVVAVPPVLVPERESEHAYVRWLEGVTYVCPWQTRLRSWLALGELRATAAPPLAHAFAPEQAERAASAFVGHEADGLDGAAARVYIRTSTWSVPLTWFVPFAPTERWLHVGGGPEAGSVSPSGSVDPSGATIPAAPATAVTRALLYATAMAQARQRVARAVAVVRGAIRLLPDARGPLLSEALATEAELTGLGRWLAEFHPYSLIELDYGGLVHLLSENALRADESVAEISAAIEALARSEWEVAVAMHQRALARWRMPRATAGAN